MSQTTAPKTPFLPPFPVMQVVLSEDKIQASSQGTETYTQELENTSVLTAEELNTYGAKLVAKVLAELNLADDVRVEFFDTQGNQHGMWYSTEFTALYPLKTPGLAPVGTKANQVSSSGLLARLPGLAKLNKELRALVLILLSLALVILLAFGARWLLDKWGTKEDNASPPAAQLPVTAPAGWDTYADYAVEASMVNPVLKNQEIIYAHEAELRRINADTGIDAGTTSVSFNISAIYESSGLAEDTVAVAGSGSQAAIGTVHNEALNTIEPPEEQTTLQWISGVPVYQGTGFIWVPNEKGELKRYTAPADSEPAVIDGQSIWMVSTKEPKAWHIHSDSAELPESVSIPGLDGYTYKGLISGINHHIVLAWGKEDLSDTMLEIIDATGEHQLENARSLPGTASEYSTVTDPERNLLLSQGTFVDVSTNQAMKVGTSAKYGAGYAWVSGIESQRVSVDGEVISWDGTSNSVIPSAIDAAGRAIVIYKPTSSSEPLGKLYVLAPAR